MEPDVSDYLSDDRILLDLRATTRDEAIDEMLSVVRHAEEINDFDQFADDVRRREDLCTTGIGGGSAFPHARCDAVNKLLVVFGRSVSGVDFGAVDGAPVHTILLIGAPDADLRAYQKVVSHVNLTVRERSVREALLSASSAGEVRSVLSCPLI